MGSFREPTLLSNATRIGFGCGCHLFCIGFGIFRPAQEVSNRHGDRNLQVVEFDLQKKVTPS